MPSKAGGAFPISTFSAMLVGALGGVAVHPASAWVLKHRPSLVAIPRLHGAGGFCGLLVAVLLLRLSLLLRRANHSSIIIGLLRLRLPFAFLISAIAIMLYQSRGQSAYFFLAAAPVLIDTARWYFSSQYNQPPDIFTGYPKDSIGREQVIKNLYLASKLKVP
jgi:hypothetical protein